MNRYRIQIRLDMNSGFIDASDWLECTPCAAALRELHPDTGYFRIVDEKGQVVIGSTNRPAAEQTQSALAIH